MSARRTILTRFRSRWRAAALIAASLLAASCGSGDERDEVDETGPSISTETSHEQASEASTVAPEVSTNFPVSVPHEHGSTIVEDRPERIVTLGYSDHDFVLAFGEVPPAVTDWYGNKPFATWEWAQDELGDRQPDVLNQGGFTGIANYNFEAIAALEPDLIIALYTDMDEVQYDTLSAIAPTIAPSGDYPECGMPWQETTRIVGLALGQPERAEELIAEVDAILADAAAAHPEFAGVEMVVAEQFEPGSSFARSANDPRTKLLTSLGFVLPTEIADLAGDLDGAEISDEQMGLLDRELLVWNVGHEPSLRAEIESKPLYPALEVVQAGHSVFIEDPLIAGALTWGTVLSLPYAVDGLVPTLADALAD